MAIVSSDGLSLACWALSIGENVATGADEGGCCGTAENKSGVGAGLITAGDACMLLVEVVSLVGMFELLRYENLDLLGSDEDDLKNEGVAPPPDHRRLLAFPGLATVYTYRIDCNECKKYKCGKDNYQK
jgi:hypothetical protein